MSLYTKRVSQLEFDLDIQIENGNNPATKLAPQPMMPTTAALVPTRDVTITAGDKVLKVSLSKDGAYLEIEYLKKKGPAAKSESVVRMSL